MRLNNWSIAASYDIARIFAGLGFSSSTASRSIGVPEPSTWVMMLLGFAGLGYAGFKRASKITLA